MKTGQVVYFSDAPRTQVSFTLPGVSQRMLFFDARGERTGNAVAASFFSADFLEERFDVVVFRGDGPPFAEAVAHDPALKLLGARLPAVCLIGGRTKGSRSPRVVKPRWSSIQTLPDLPTLRAAEMLGLLHAREAILNDPRAHYKIASGYHQESYVRLRDALQDATDVARIADWLLPKVNSNTALLGDRPSLLPLMQAVALEALRRFGWDLRFATLEPFPRHTRSAAQSISDLVSSGASSLLIVIGVDYMARHEKELLVLSPRRSRSTCLVDLSPSGPAAADFAVHYPVPRLSATKDHQCELCSSLELHEVDVRTEERVPSPRRQPARVTPALVRQHRLFWTAVDEANALRLHRAVHYPENFERETRHRPIDFNTARLVMHPAFRAHCRAQLEKMREPDVVLIPAHDGTSAVSHLIAEVFPGLEQSTVLLERGRLNDPAVAAITRARRVLLADNEIITGNTIRRLLDSIQQRIGPAHWAKTTVTVFALVASTTDATPLRTIRNRVYKPEDADREGLLMGAEIPLPADDACPWCEEAHWLANVEGKLPKHSRLIARRARRLRQSGASPESLVVYSGIPHAPEEDPSLVRGSVVGERVSAGVAFAAFASAVQSLRFSEEMADLETPFYFDLSHMLENWWGPALYAGMLRTLDESELKYSAQDNVLLDTWHEQEATLTPAELVEFGWAAILDKLPPVLVPVVYDAMRQYATSSPAIAFLSDLLATVRPAVGAAN